MATATMNPTQSKARPKTDPTPAPQGQDGKAARLLSVAAPLATRLLLWLSFSPVAWGFLAWAGLVPLLTLVRREGSGKANFGLAYLVGLALSPVIAGLIGALSMRAVFVADAIALAGVAWLVASRMRGGAARATGIVGGEGQSA